VTERAARMFKEEKKSLGSVEVDWESFHSDKLSACLLKIQVYTFNGNVHVRFYDADNHALYAEFLGTIDRAQHCHVYGKTTSCTDIGDFIRTTVEVFGPW
jgi:hypothetical protein